MKHWEESSQWFLLSLAFDIMNDLCGIFFIVILDCEQSLIFLCKVTARETQACERALKPGFYIIISIVLIAWVFWNCIQAIKMTTWRHLWCEDRGAGFNLNNQGNQALRCQCSNIFLSVLFQILVTKIAVVLLLSTECPTSNMDPKTFWIRSCVTGNFYSETLHWRLWGGSVAEWLERWTRNPAAPGASPPLTASWTYSR